MLIELHNVDIGYDDNYLLRNVNLQIETGHCHCISGATGCGKSSLLQLLAGTFEHSYQGQVKVKPNCIVGLVCQDPNVQIIRQTIGAEVAFALENLAVPLVEMQQQVRHSLQLVGLDLALNTPISHLSLGQKYRLMIAAQLVCHPSVLLLDEPWAQLDDQGVTELLGLLSGLLQRNIAVVIVEHNYQAFSSLITHAWHIDQAQLFCGDYLVKQSKGVARQRPCYQDSAATYIETAAFELGFESSILFACQQPLTLQAGQVIAVVGSNGCGKTSLLKLLAGFDPQVKKLSVQVLQKLPELGVYGANLGFLTQRPSRQLFETTVLKELQFSLSRFDLPLSYASNILIELDLVALSELSPHKLSYGQQHLIALACLACINPKVLLLDDPFAGLDDYYSNKVIKLIERLVQQGCGVIFSTHRDDEMNLADTVWRIEQGLLTVESQSFTSANDWDHGYDDIA